MVHGNGIRELHGVGWATSDDYYHIPLCARLEELNSIRYIEVGTF